MPGGARGGAHHRGPGRERLRGDARAREDRASGRGAEGRVDGAEHGRGAHGDHGSRITASPPGRAGAQRARRVVSGAGRVRRRSARAGRSPPAAPCAGIRGSLAPSRPAAALRVPPAGGHVEMRGPAAVRGLRRAIPDAPKAQDVFGRRCAGQGFGLVRGGHVRFGAASPGSGGPLARRPMSGTGSRRVAHSTSARRSLHRIAGRTGRSRALSSAAPRIWPDGPIASTPTIAAGSRAPPRRAPTAPSEQRRDRCGRLFDSISSRFRRALRGEAGPSARSART